MKKITGLCAGITFMMLLAVSANAQFHLGVRGGLNVAAVRFDSDLFSEGTQSGFHIGPTIELMVPGIGVGVEVAALYSQKGLYNDLEKRNLSVDYIDVPVNLKLKLGIPLIKAYLSAGPYASFCLGDIGKNSLDDIKHQFKTRTFGAGVNFGAGLEVFSAIQVGFNYGLGLTDDYSTSNPSDLVNGAIEDIVTGKANVISATVALLF